MTGTASNPEFLTPGGALVGPLFASLCGRPQLRASLTPGTEIGRYRIVALIGRGGSGEVYRAARSDGAFDQDVALKIVRDEGRHDARFRRERNILGRLGHPGIARIHDGGRTEDGRLWCAMELVRGERIDDWCQTHAIDWRGRIERLATICDAVQYAHSRMVVHRDIKPGNVLVDDSGLPRLLDFGISDRPGRAADAGDHAFTPGFASPEQLAGGEVTAQSDVYQLGRLIEILFAPDATHRAPRLVAANLRALVAAATADAIARRPPTAATLREELSRVLAGRPCRVRRWPLPARLRFFARRHRLALAIAVAGFLALAAATVHHAQRIAVERARAETEARNATTTAEVLANLFRTATSMLDEGDADRLNALLDRAAAGTVRRFAEVPRQRTIATQALARVYLDLGQPEKARDLVAATLADLDRDGAGAAGERALLHRLSMQLALDVGDVDAARAHHAHAAHLQREMPGDAEASFALEAARIALLRRDAEDESVSRARSTLITRMEDAGADRSALFAELLTDRAFEADNANDTRGAAADFDRAQRLIADRYGPASPQAMNLEGLWLWKSLDRKDVAAIDRRLRRYRRLVLESFGEHSREFGAVLTFEGIVAWERGDFATSEDRFGAAHALMKNLFGEAHIAVAAAAHNYADALQERGRPALALPLYEHALRLRLRRHPETFQPLLVNRLQIARAQCALGDPEAPARFAPIRSALRERMDERHPTVLLAAAFHADCLLRHGHIEEARALYAQTMTPPILATVTGVARARLAAIGADIERAAAFP